MLFCMLIWINFYLYIHERLLKYSLKTLKLLITNDFEYKSNYTFTE